MRQKSVTVRQIQDLDETAIREYGVPSLALMENAGRAVAIEVIRLLNKAKTRGVCIICGLGNNAGDGFVAARHLVNAGIKTKIYLVGRPKQLKHDAAVNYRVLKRLKYPITEVRGPGRSFIRDIAGAGVVVDAIFGVGLNREIGEPFRNVIEAVNKHAKRIVAVDTPSGLDGTTGRVCGVCVQADTTVTFSFSKRGFYKAQGPRYTGKIIVVDIGIPKRIVNGKW